MERKALPETGAIRVVGTMSGTSLDGVDAAVLETDGVTISDFGPTAFRPYSEADQAVLRTALGRWPEDGVAQAAVVVEDAHAEVLDGMDADLIGFHGQTLAHDPGTLRTHQAGDGAALAQRLGCPVAWDFRSADVAAGGQGAPLAPAFHFALSRWIGADEPLAFLNLGGVGNLTWIDPSAEGPFDDGAMLAFDTGPANAPLNDLVRARRGWARDDGGDLAGSASPDKAVLVRFAVEPYFEKTPPKSLDRNDFPGLLTAVEMLGDAEAASTLVQAAVESVVRGLTWCPAKPARVLVTGGGRHNATMMGRLAAALTCPVAPVEDADLDGDMIEAQAFAYLAVRTARGLPITGPGTTGVATPLAGGRVSYPE